MKIEQLAELLKIPIEELKKQLNENDEVVIDLNEPQKPDPKDNIKIEII